MTPVKFICTFVFACLIASFSQAESDRGTENLIRANEQNQQHLIQVIRDLKAVKKDSSIWSTLNTTVSDRRHCDEDDNVSCVPNCINRGATGTCYSYGSDFCAPDAKCAANCTQRGATGTCYTYGPDYCGTDANCTPNCTQRGATGTCYTYGPDICY